MITTIKNCGKYYYRPDKQTIIGTIISFRTIYPDENNNPQGNQARFPQGMAGPHRGIDQESQRKICEHENGTTEHETTGT